MNQGHQDLSARWAGQLGRVDGARREAIVAALSHSEATGWPASAGAVELLVSYSLGSITSRDYASGILRELRAAPDEARVRGVPASEVPTWSGAVDPDVPTDDLSTPEVQTGWTPEPDAPAVAPAAGAGTISREDAVHAYVTGQIPVGEFLRIARS